MKFLIIIILALSFLYSEEKSNFALVIHGGAGTILKKNMTAEKERDYKQKLEESLQAGYKILLDGGSAMDAVEAAIHLSLIHI